MSNMSFQLQPYKTWGSLQVGEFYQVEDNVYCLRTGAADNLGSCIFGDRFFIRRTNTTIYPVYHSDTRELVGYQIVLNPNTPVVVLPGILYISCIRPNRMKTKRIYKPNLLVIITSYGTTLYYRRSPNERKFARAD